MPQKNKKKFKKFRHFAKLYYYILRRGADKVFGFFLFPIFLFAAQKEQFFLDGLKKLEQRSHKCVELRGEYVE
jgi:hypothetical protein